MKLNFWQILGMALIVAGLLYSVFNRAKTTPNPAAVPPSLAPEMTTQPS